eukprot:TRINITY_DN1051_c0_g1_i3.p1 TRINITY_DN1051_c0_g1~~TRINITY_DN1051_c0_g1_i3.p1  ORF type:complete len:343 (-),score=53.15 TRINITY_DN1051_c0_g1_i3:531-1559(-)
MEDSNCSSLPACPTSPRVGFQEGFNRKPHVSVADDLPDSGDLLHDTYLKVMVAAQQSRTNSETQTTPTAEPRRGEYLKERKSTRYFIVRVPKSAYGVAAIMPVLAEVKSCRDWFRINFLSYLAVVANAMFQLAFVQGISQITSRHGELSCDDLAMDPDLVILCIGVYLMMIANDIEETFDLAELYFDLIPTTSAWHSETIGFDDDNNVVSGGMSVCRKVLLGIFVLGLKLVIACLLGIYGVAYLVSSANDSELLLNTLALEFILGVDEMIYDSMAPASTRSLMKQLPPFKTNSRRAFFKWADCLSPIFKIVFCAWTAKFALSVIHPETADCVAEDWMKWFLD